MRGTFLYNMDNESDCVSYILRASLEAALLQHGASLAHVFFSKGKKRYLPVLFSHSFRGEIFAS